MANGAFKFKDNSGNVVSFISGSGPNISFSGGTLDLSGMTGLTLGNLTLSGTTQNALSASHAASYLLTSSFNTYSGTTDTVIGTLQTSTSSLNSFTSSATTRLNSIETSTGSLNTFTSSATTRLDSIEGVSGSYATTGSNLFKGNQTISGSIIPAVDNAYDLGSVTHQFRDLYLSSASLYIDGTKVLGSTAQELQITTDTGQSFKILEAGSDTITLQSADGNITLTSSGGGDVIMDPTNGIIALKGTTTVYSGHKIVSSDGNSIQFGNGIAVTGSIISTVTPLVSGSSQISYTGLSNIPSGIVSSSTQLPSGIVSSSLQVTGYGFSTTGSNVFVGSQVITGSLYITTDLVVQGCSSLQNITASAVSIGTNTVMLNTSTPAVRFAGISVQDSGSNVGVTGSIYWDGLCNRWIYSNPSNIGYSGGMLLSGPRTATLGSEAPLTCNYIAKSGGGDHLYDSCIIDDGTTVCINANTITNKIIVSNNQNTATQVTICNTTCNTAATSELAIGSDVCSGFASIGKYSTGTTAYKTIAPKDMYIYNQTGGDISVINNITSGNIKFTAGGCSSPHLYINCNGNVGIGTSCPANVLHTKSSQPRIIVDTTDRYAVFNMWACGSEKGAMYWDNTDLALKFESNQGYWFIAGGSERLRITCAGNVGIGTCSPTPISTYTTLEIRGATGGGIKIGKTGCSQFNIQQDGTDAYFNNTANGALYIYTNDAERMKITSGGIVGINTDNLTSPGLTGASLFIRPSSSNVGQSAIAIQDYRKCTRWVINGQDGCDNFNFAIYSTPNNTNDYTRRFLISQDGNVGIGSACPKIRLQVTPSYNAESPILGCASGVAIFTSSNTNYGLQFNSTSDGSFHIQSQRFDAISTAYSLILNYAGGNVGVGLSNPVEGMDVQMALRIRCNTPNFTAACNSLVIDYVNTCIFGSSPTARYYSIGCTGVSAGHQFLVGVPAAGFTALNILGNGTVTRQCQPYFYADTLNGANLAGNQTPIWTNLRASQGSGYSTSTGRFTAPVTGVYAFSWVYLYGGISNYAGCIDDGFSLNGTMIYSGNRFKICQKATGDGYVAVQGSVVLKLAANDYFSVMTQNAGDGSLVGYGGSTWGYLTGALI